MMQQFILFASVLLLMTQCALGAPVIRDDTSLNHLKNSIKHSFESNDQSKRLTNSTTHTDDIIMVYGGKDVNTHAPVQNSIDAA